MGGMDDPRAALDACTVSDGCESTAHLLACPRHAGQRPERKAHAGYLTSLEISVITRLGECWDDICHIVGSGPTRDDDLREMRDHLHALQRTIGSQAAARAHPEEFHLLGDRL